MDLVAFETLVLNHKDGLKPFALSLTHDYHAAEDLCQETLYKAFAYRHQYQDGTNVRAWLFTIMRNIFINEYRRKARGEQVLEVVKYFQQKQSLSAEISIRLKEINHAIHQLPGIFKTACTLYLQGYKYQEIAFALNEPLGTIKSRIHFAKKILQQNLDR